MPIHTPCLYDDMGTVEQPHPRFPRWVPRDCHRRRSSVHASSSLWSSASESSATTTTTSGTPPPVITLHTAPWQLTLFRSHGWHQYEIVLSLVGHGDSSTPPPEVAQNGFARRGYSYVHMTFEQFVVRLPQLRLEDRFFTYVLPPNVPVHLYFDLDANFEMFPHLRHRVGDEVFLNTFLAHLVVVFATEFGRPPDLGGLLLLEAHSARKMSWHVHVSTEVFANSTHLKQFVRRIIDRLIASHVEQAAASSGAITVARSERATPSSAAASSLSKAPEHDQQSQESPTKRARREDTAGATPPIIVQSSQQPASASWQVSSEDDMDHDATDSVGVCDAGASAELRVPAEAAEPAAEAAASMDYHRPSLCATLPNQTTFACVVDLKVYNGNQNFRCPYNRKPGGQPLLPRHFEWRSASSICLSSAVEPVVVVVDEDVLFHAHPALALCMREGAAYLTMASDSGIVMTGSMRLQDADPRREPRRPWRPSAPIREEEDDVRRQQCNNNVSLASSSISSQQQQMAVPSAVAAPAAAAAGSYSAFAQTGRQ